MPGITSQADPVAYVTTDNYAVVPGSTVTTILGDTGALSITVSNTGANSIKWEVVATNEPVKQGADIDISTAHYVVVCAEATLANAVTAGYTEDHAHYRHYAVLAKASVGSSQGAALVHALAKG